MAKRIHKAADTSIIDTAGMTFFCGLKDKGGKIIGEYSEPVKTETSKAGKPYTAVSLTPKRSRFGVNGVVDLGHDVSLTFSGDRVFVDVPHLDYVAAAAAPAVDITAIVAKAIAAAMAAKA